MSNNNTAKKISTKDQMFQLIETVKLLTQQNQMLLARQNQEPIKVRDEDIIILDSPQKPTKEERLAQPKAKVKEIAQARKDKVVLEALKNINPETGDCFTVAEIRNAFTIAHNYTRIVGCEKGAEYKRVYNEKLVELIGVTLY